MIRSLGDRCGNRCEGCGSARHGTQALYFGLKVSHAALESAEGDQGDDQQDGHGQYRQADQDQYPRQIIHRIDSPLSADAASGNRPGFAMRATQV